MTLAQKAENAAAAAGNEPIAYLRDEFVPFSRAVLPVTDLGVVGGVAVAEMLRTFGHHLFRAEAHWERLAASLDVVGLSPNVSMNTLTEICNLLVAQHARANAARGVVSVQEYGVQEYGVIVSVTAGLNPTYVGRDAAKAAGPTLFAHTFPLRQEVYQRQYREGIALVCPPVLAIPREVVPPTIKSRSRLHWRLAERAAHEIDPVASAILADSEGRLTETAFGNLCLVIEGEVLSPREGTVLEGISLQTVADLCAAEKIPFVRRDIWPDDLALADEAFVTSTPSGMVPVTRFESVPLGKGQPGPITIRLLRAWQRLVGQPFAGL